MSWRPIARFWTARSTVIGPTPAIVDRSTARSVIPQREAHRAKVLPKAVCPGVVCTSDEPTAVVIGVTSDFSIDTYGKYFLKSLIFFSKKCQDRLLRVTNTRRFSKKPP